MIGFIALAAHFVAFFRSDSGGGGGHSAMSSSRKNEPAISVTLRLAAAVARHAFVFAHRGSMRRAARCNAMRQNDRAARRKDVDRAESRTRTEGRDALQGTAR